MPSPGDADQAYSDLAQRMAEQEQAELEWEAVKAAEQEEVEEAATRDMGFPLDLQPEAEL